MVVDHIARNPVLGKRIQVLRREPECACDSCVDVIALLEIDVLEQIAADASRGNGIPIHIDSVQMRDRPLHRHQPLAEVLVNSGLNLSCHRLWAPQSALAEQRFSQLPVLLFLAILSIRSGVAEAPSRWGWIESLRRRNQGLTGQRSQLAYFFGNLLAIAVFCNQHYPKTRLPSHHLRVRSGCLIEWDCLDHRRHATQGTETKRCVSSGRVSRQRTCHFALSEYEIHARDLDRLRSDAEVNGDTAGSKALKGLSDCFAS